jgi:hypothetical protein
LKPPAVDELEVSLLGPGFGETVVVHLGQSRWMIVDSCHDSESGEPAAIRYLEQIGVDPQDVVTIVATHWHDDHVRGLAKTVERCPHAHFYFSAMLRETEFLQLLEAGRRSMMASSGVSELARIDDVFADRRLRSGKRPMLAGPNRILWEDGATQVRSLAPSDAGIIDSMRFVAQSLPSARAAKRRIGDPGPNHTSVVLWVTTPYGTALLGADLQRRRRLDLGWNGVLNLPGRPTTPAGVFKIPHHGSANADDERVWAELLDPDPIALLTPFVRSGLPKEADVARICANTSRAFATAPARAGTRRPRAPEVDAMIDSAAAYVKEAETATGHVRVRLRAGGEPTIDLFGPAHSMCEPEGAQTVSSG